MGKQQTKRKSMKRANSRLHSDGLPECITWEMIAQAEREMRRNKANIDSGTTYRAHQTSNRAAPGKRKSGKYS